METMLSPAGQRWDTLTREGRDMILTDVECGPGVWCAMHDESRVPGRRFRVQTILGRAR